MDQAVTVQLLAPMGTLVRGHSDSGRRCVCWRVAGRNVRGELAAENVNRFWRQFVPVVCKAGSFNTSERERVVSQRDRDLTRGHDEPYYCEGCRSQDCSLPPTPPPSPQKNRKQMTASVKKQTNQNTEFKNECFLMSTKQNNVRIFGMRVCLDWYTNGVIL